MASVSGPSPCPHPAWDRTGHRSGGDLNPLLPIFLSILWVWCSPGQPSILPMCFILPPSAGRFPARLVLLDWFISSQNLPPGSRPSPQTVPCRHPEHCCFTALPSGFHFPALPWISPISPISIQSRGTFPAPDKRRLDLFPSLHRERVSSLPASCEHLSFPARNVLAFKE